MGNQSGPSNNGKPMDLITETIETLSNSRDSSLTVAASERVLNGAILAAEISESFEEHLKVFDGFYADDIQVTADALNFGTLQKLPTRAFRK